MSFNYNNIQQVYATGSGTLVYDVQPRDPEPWFLMGLTVGFSSGGTGTATMRGIFNSWKGAIYDHEKFTSAAIGITSAANDADYIFTSMTQSTANSWYFGMDPKDATSIDVLTLAWVNPGSIVWGLEAQVLPARFVTGVW